MPEHSPNYQSDDDESDENPRNSKERASWRAYEAARAEPNRWRNEPEATPQPVPVSEEVRRYAAERQAHLLTELSLAEEEDEENDEEQKDTKPKEELADQLPQETKNHSSVEEEKSTAQTEESPVQEAETETAIEQLPEERVEALKQIAREELQKHEPEAVGQNPVTDYLEKVALEGDPTEAEQEIVMDYHLDEVRAEADLAIEGLEDLLEEAATKIGDKKFSDEELTDIARELVPDTEEPEGEADMGPPDLEAFAPEPSDIPTLPGAAEADHTVVTKGYRFSGSHVRSRIGSGSLPPIPPYFRGGGGGSGGLHGSGGGRLSYLASMAAGGNPNMLVAHAGMSAAELARQRRKTLTVALFAGLLGYYLGKKKGRKQQEAKMKPELERKEKDNKQLRYEVQAGQQRIDSLKRLKEQQEKETYERERREKFKTPEKQPATQSKEERSQSPIESSTPTYIEQPEQILSGAEQEQVSVSPAAPEQWRPIVQEQPEVVATSPVLPETPLGKPELPPEQIVRSETPPTMPPERQEERFITDHPAEAVGQEVKESHAPEESMSAAEFPASSSVEAIQPEVPSPEAFESEAIPTSAWSRPEIASTRPGLEIPLSPGLLETQPISSQSESGYERPETPPPMQQPEAFDVSTVAAMNMPDLLAVAQEMTVGGENLGQLFQENQIDAAGLRRVVAEYARGGRPEQILAQERQIMEVRHQSPEFLQSQTTNHQGGGAASQVGGGAGLFTQTEQSTDHLLPAYDHEQYPSDTPQHLLPAYDQETITKKHHRIVIAASAMIGLGAGIILGLLLL